MVLNFTLQIDNPNDADQAKKLIDLFKVHWNKAEAVVAARKTDDQPVKSPTIEAARAALDGVVNKTSMMDGLEILKSFGATKLSDLPQDRYGDFVNICQEAAA